MLKRAKTVVAIFAIALVGVPFIASAQISGGATNINSVASTAGVSGGTDLMTIIGRIVNIFLGFLGVIFLVLMIYAGFQWMTSAGDPKKVESAKLAIRNAVIGLFIVASAFAITNFIFGLFAGVAGDLGGVSSTGGGPGVGGLRGSAGALGDIIEMHYPPRDATGVPRNAAILITFKKPIDPSTFIQDWTVATSGTATGIKSDFVKIYQTKNGETSALTSGQARVSYTSDLKTFRIKPVDYLGSATNPTAYTVSLKGGMGGIKKMDGSAALGSSGYVWSFEVSTVVDLTPPKVVFASPVALGSYAKNIVIQIVFNEAVDPIASSGRTPNIEVRASEPGSPTSVIVPGEFRISNQYQNIEFVPDLSCGQNTCGKQIFCLPGLKDIQILAKAATLDPKSTAPQAALTTSGYDGIVDIAGNSLDGNGDGKGDGPPTDSYSWTFGTSDLVHVSPPQITQTTPGSAPGTNDHVPLDQPVKAVFDSMLQSSTVNTDNVILQPKGPSETNPDTFWWTTGVNLLTASGADFSTAGPTDVATKMALMIMHRPYLASGTLPTPQNLYIPHITSGVQDQYQNCFNPAKMCATGDGGPNCCDGVGSVAACVFK
jgi:hypothetical protein